MVKFLLNFCILTIFSFHLAKSQHVKSILGTIKNYSNVPIADAIISINGINLDSPSDKQGGFRLDSNLIKLPFTISFMCKGYEKITRVIYNSKELKQLKTIMMEPIYPLGETMQINAMRLPETLIQTPITVQKIEAKDIRYLSSSDYYGTLSNLNGVDLVSSGYLMKQISSHGFSSTGNQRLNQRVDGMDNQSPSFNFSFGTLNGITEIDLDNIEFTNSASSALYGSGGTNGTLFFTSKNPFKYQGLSFQIKQGFNHFNSNRSGGGPSPFTDWNVRWGQKVNDKFAYKITAQFITLTDWLASDNRNYSRLPTSNNPWGTLITGNRFTDPNYDGVNVYGDEINRNIRTPPSALLQEVFIPTGTLKGQLGNINVPSQIFSRIANQDILYSRTGFNEEQVLDGQTDNFKLNAGFYFKLTNKIKLDFVVNYGTGSSAFSNANRYGLKNISLIQPKLEVYTDNWFIRAYFTAEQSGNTYNASVASQIFNDLWPLTTPSTDPSILNTYLQNFAQNNGDDNWYQTAFQGAILPPLYAVGSNAYRIAIEGAYNTAYDAAIRNGLTANQAYQQGLQAINGVRSSGITSAQNSVINYFNNATNQLQLLNNGRSVANANIPTGAIYNDPRFQYIINTPISQGGAKISSQSQLRTLEFQYNFTEPLNLKPLQLDWILGGSFRQNYLVSQGSFFADTTLPFTYIEAGLYTQASKWFFDFWKLTVSARYDYQQNYSGQFTPRVAMDFKLFKKHHIRFSAQTGFRFPSNQNQYLNLKIGPGVTSIGGLPFIWDKYNLTSNPAYTETSVILFRNSIINGAQDENLLQQRPFKALKPETNLSLELGYRSVFFDKLLVDAFYYFSSVSNLITQENIYQPREDLSDILNYNNTYLVPVNATSQFISHGWGIAADYNVYKTFTIKANVSSDNILTDIPSENLSFFNTPKIRFNIGVQNPRFLFKGILGFQVNYRWQDQINYQSTFGVGNIPAFGTLDASINLNILSLKSILKLGGTNITNHYYINSFGGPSIGGLYYISFAYNLL